MSTEFTTVISRLKKLKERYFFTLSAFYVYEAMRELKAPNIVGEDEVKKNLETMKKFNNFFGIVQEALRVYFLLELAKLFDSSDQALHIMKIINYTESNLKKLSVNDFAEFNQSREFIDELIKNYRGISRDDLQKMKLQLEQHQETIGDLKTYRDKYLAHDDFIKVDVKLTPERITNLFKILEEILNLFSSRLDISTTLYNRLEERYKDDTKRVIEYLRRFEPYRLKEIEEYYQKELEKYKQ